MAQMKPDCPHRFVHQGERWYGQGKYVYWQCKECDAYLRPNWKVVDVLGHPIPEEPIFPVEEK